jgi:hypothetical protein
MHTSQPIHATLKPEEKKGGGGKRIPNLILNEHPHKKVGVAQIIRICKRPKLRTIKIFKTFSGRLIESSVVKPSPLCLVKSVSGLPQILVQ